MYLIFISALFSVLAFNSKLVFFVFISATPLFLFFIHEKKIVKLLAGVFLFRLIFMLGTVYFVLDPIVYFLSILIFLGLPLSFYLIRKFFSLFTAILFLPFFWVVFDYFTAQYTLLPMTVVMLGSPLANSAFVGLAKIGGVVGLTFFAALINLLLTLFILFKKRRKMLIGFMALIFILAAGLSCFFIDKNKKEYLSRGRELNVALLSAGKNRAEFDDLLTMIFLNKKTDLLIVPEDFYFKSNLEDFNKVIDFYGGTAKKLKTDLLAVFSQKENEEIFKSGVLFSKDGEVKSVYHKNRLTITSEYWPFENWRPFYFNIYLKSLPEEERRKAIFDSSYQFAKGGASLLKSDNFSFAVPICGEFHYLNYMKQLNGLNPDFILHNSENDWIKNGLKQYLKLTNNLRKIQSVQFRKPIFVNGIGDYAGVFYPDGTSELVYPGQDLALFNAKVRF